MGGKSITVTGVPSIGGSPFAESAQNSLTNHLLIAMPSLADPNFSQTVALICEHTDKGALGIVLNKPLPMKLSDVLSQMKLEPARRSTSPRSRCYEVVPCILTVASCCIVRVGNGITPTRCQTPSR